MTKHLFKRKIFWDNVTQSVQIALGLLQVGTMGARVLDVEQLEVNPLVNAISGAVQIFLGISNIWTKDANNDGWVDISQLPDTGPPTITEITTTVTSKGPATVTTEEKNITPKE